MIYNWPWTLRQPKRRIAMPSRPKVDRKKVLEIATELEKMARRRGEDLVAAGARKFLQLATGRKSIARERLALQRRLAEIEAKAKQA